MAPENAYVRVSVLGIGNSASTAMCEGIARVGNGTCMLVGEDETTFTGKIARMLRAAKTPPIAELSIDWGHSVAAKESNEKVPTSPACDDFEIVEEVSEKTKKTLNIFDEGIKDPLESNTTPPPPPPEVVLPPVSPVQQTPFHIQNLFPNIRLSAYAILQGKTIPKNVILRGSIADGAEIELRIPVVLSQLEDAPDLEDGKHALAKTLTNPDDKYLLARTVKASVVRLGKTYSIASSRTSFVAVDDSQPQLRVQYAPCRLEMGLQAQAHLMSSPTRAPIDLSGSSTGGSFGFGSLGLGSAVFGLMSGTMSAVGKSVWSGAAAPSPGSPINAGNNNPRVTSRARRRSRRPPGRGSAEAEVDNALIYDAAVDLGIDCRALDDTLRSAQGAAISELRSQAQAETMSPRGGNPLRAALVSNPYPGGTSVDLLSAPAPVVVSSDPLESLARIQFFDGGFSLEVLSVIKLTTDIEAVRSGLPAGATDEIVATVLAMAFLSTKLGATMERDPWEPIYEKAQQYVAVALQKIGVARTAEALEAAVTQFLA
ncbi:hypothetical protein B0H12DRAFT_1231661 [Mycena haematopus]|nr:hypothetical protein B0H12DRAFT_1231661 [Mycena haematopus]